MWSRFLFWLQSRNRHGIHSPFVYNFLDKALYQKSLKGYPSEKKLLLAITDYLPLKTTAYGPHAGETFNWLTQRKQQLKEGPPPYDLYIFDSPSQHLIHALARKHNWHNESVVFVGNLHREDPLFSFWEQACKESAVTVVIEGYRAGLLFFRKQQARQHFRIRI